MRFLFIHHSTGANLIKEGTVRALLAQFRPDIEFWDHSYNLYTYFPLVLATITYHTGLSNSKGQPTGTDYDIVLSNNSPKEYAEIFSSDPTKNETLKKILAFDCIAFKNCYPTSNIATDEQLAEYKRYYEIIRNSLQKYPKKTFILFTSPPLRKELTTTKNALRARNLASWLSSNEFLRHTKNLQVFNFFDLLADSDGENKNRLKRRYCRFIFIDGHPNKKANEEVGKLFIKWIANLFAVPTPLGRFTSFKTNKNK